MKKVTETNNCHVCNGTRLESPSYGEFSSITSDCKPWNSKNKLYICVGCSLVQKELDETWYDDIKNIYSSYSIYSQSDGNEQVIFNETKGIRKPRSEILCDWIKNNLQLADNSKLLDVGCGTGVFLKAFTKTRPNWKLYGLENSEKNKETLKSIPNFQELYSDPENIKEKFDIISFIHSLEHIPHPNKFIEQITPLLNKNGTIIIQVPDVENSPFDVLIADHCSHFSLNSLEKCLNLCGFKISHLSNSIIKKEISIIATFDSKNKISNLVSIDKDAHSRIKNLLEARSKWLKNMLLQAQSIEGKIGIFGSSISGTWLAASVKNVSFFVEEDTNKIGKTHIGIPIISLDQIPKDSKVLMPLRYDIAKNIKNRLKIEELVDPPELHE